MSGEILKAGFVLITGTIVMMVLALAFGSVIDAFVLEMSGLPMDGIGARLVNIPLTEFKWAMQLIIVWLVIMAVWFIKVVLKKATYSGTMEEEGFEEY